MAIQQSRKQRRIRVKTPAGRATIRYEKRRKAKATCSNCYAKLHGVHHDMGLAASKRNPSRPYAGVLCSRCGRQAIKEKMVAQNA